jgi:hypothetical protein
MCATPRPNTSEPALPFVTGQPPCRTGASMQLAAALTQHSKNADTTPLVRACVQGQSPRIPIRGAACSFARGKSRPGPCYDCAPHPPLDQERVFCQATRRAPPRGPAVAPVIAALPPPPPNLNLLHHLCLAPAPALCFSFPIPRVLSHQ